MPPAADDVGDVGGGPARAGHAAAPDGGLEEQRQRLLDGGDGVAGGAVVAGQGTLQQPVPQRRRAGMVEQDFGGFVGGQGSCHPAQHPVQGVRRRGRRRGSSTAALWRPRRRRSGLRHRRCCGRGFDGAGGERFGSAFGHHRVDAAGDRVPDQFGQPGGLAERVTHHAGPVAAVAGGEGEQQVVGFGEGDQGGAGCGEQGGAEQVQGFAGALRADHPGGAVPRAPQVPGVGFGRFPDPPPHLGRVEPRCGRSCCVKRMSGSVSDRGSGAVRAVSGRVIRRARVGLGWAGRRFPTAPPGIARGMAVQCGLDGGVQPGREAASAWRSTCVGGMTWSVIALSSRPSSGCGRRGPAARHISRATVALAPSPMSPGRQRRPVAAGPSAEPVR